MTGLGKATEPTARRSSRVVTVHHRACSSWRVRTGQGVRRPCRRCRRPPPGPPPAWSGRAPGGPPRRPGCGRRRPAGPRPRGVFTTSWTLPPAMSSTASAARPSSPTLATSVSTGTPWSRRYPAVPRVAAREKPRSAKLAGHVEAGRLVPVGQGEEHRARRGQPGAGGHLALGEGQAEGRVDPHHLAGRAHLGAEQGVDAGEAVEGQHRLLHADVARAWTGARAARRRAGPRPAASARRGADHHPGRHHGHGHPGGLGDEGHRAAGPRVGLEDEDLAVLHRVLHVEQAQHPERLGQRPGVAVELVEHRRPTGSGAAGRRPSRPSGRRPPRRAP